MNATATLFDAGEITARPRWFGARVLRPAVAGAELPGTLTIHGLRHIAATSLEEVNAPLGVRQHRLGHAAQGITLRTYTHVPDALDRAVADRLDDLFRNSEVDRNDEQSSPLGRRESRFPSTGSV